MAEAKTDPFDPQVFLAVVGTGKTVSKYRKNQIVFSQGDAADTIYYLQKGKIKVVVVSEQGKEAVVGLIEAGQFFGEGCLNGQKKADLNDVAIESCLITAITIGHASRWFTRATFSDLFMEYLLTRNNRMEDDLIDQLFNSSEKRLARLLLLLANFGKEGNPMPINPNISQETLAEMIGTTAPA